MKKILERGYLFLIVLFLYAPILVLMVLSFNASRSRAHWAGFSLRWYAEMLANEDIMLALQNTLLIAFVSALVATILGTMAAIAIRSMKSLPRNVLLGITNIPMLNADIVTGISLLLCFLAFGISLGFRTILIAHITFNIPYVILSVMPKLRQSSKVNFEAALDLGASPLYAFFRVVLPDIFPGVLSGFLLAFTMSLDDFIITHFTRGAGINTISTLVYAEVRRGINPSMYALSTVIFLAVFLVLLLSNFAPLPMAGGRAGEAGKNWKASKAGKLGAAGRSGLSGKGGKSGVPAAFSTVLLLLVLGIAILSTGCGQGAGGRGAQDSGAADQDVAEDDGADNDDAGNAGIAGEGADTGNAPVQDAADGNVVYVYNWGEYIDPEVIDLFEEETGIKVVYDMFETNEEMYPVIEAGGAVYDVVCPSDYMIEKMLQKEMLLELDYGNLPNITEIGPEFMELAAEFDPGNRYSVPYTCGTVGIIYNKGMLDDLGVPYPERWSDLWNPALKGEILMQDSVRDAFMVTLKMNGYSMNTTDDTELDLARDELIRQKPLVQAYVVDQVRDKMLGGEAAVGVIYSGEILYIQEELEDSGIEMEYVVPEEGTNLWVDCWVIPWNAKHKENAEKWINFLCKPEIAVMNFEYITYSTPNQGAIDLLGEEYTENEALYPDMEALLEEGSEVYHYLGEEDEAKYNDRWKTVKVS